MDNTMLRLADEQHSLTPLTPEQRLIVTTPTDIRTLVIAGPGTGKTHVLIMRLIHLVEIQGLSPGQEILVLSFTRAAVYEIRSRLTTIAGAGRYVAAYTFDSFATRLLRMFSPDEGWNHLDYDGRIQAATSLIQNSSDAREYLQNFRHVFVDEIQDLVAVRASFVKFILACTSGGFTLLGDPAQSIYNYILSGEERRLGAYALLEWLRQWFGEALQEHKLTINHRAGSKLTKAALWHGQGLYERTPDYAQVRQNLVGLYRKLPSLGDIRNARPYLRTLGKTTAILCRTNGYALLVSRHLREMGVEHVYQQSATERLIPAWYAIILGTHLHPRISERAFIERVSNLSLGVYPHELWEQAKRIEGNLGSGLDIARIADRIRLGDVPDEVLQLSRSDLIVSTVHRAKGREFDRVLLLDEFGEDDKDPDIFAEETRVLYVALTRARTDLFRIGLPAIRGYVRRHAETERWVRSFDSWKFGNIEIKGGDIHHMDPAGAWLLDDCNPQQIQLYIQASVKPGDPVLLKLHDSSEGGFPRAYYEIVHNENPVGVTSELFSSTLYNILKVSPSWKVKWPLLIDELFVEAVDTVAGTPAAGQRAGLGPNGLWLRVRIYGLGRLHFTIRASN